MTGTPKPETISTKQARIAKLATQVRDAPLRTLSHHIDIDWLYEAYRRTRKSAAPGIDGVTGSDYADDLDARLRSLLDRAKAGDRYRAPPARRVYIPKGDGRSVRPLGIPTFEDKVLQRAVTMVLEPLYEQEFLDCSYGCRPERSAHQAIKKLNDEIMRIGGGWILEADIKSYFDAVDHGHLRTMIQKRVGDGVLQRLIGKWLKAGIWEEGRFYRQETGTPQGGVLSPLLANIYLHEVLDRWFEDQVKPRLRGHAVLVRYVDDFVLLFEDQDDAHRVQAVLPKRLGRFGLELHPTKTRLLRFTRPPKRRPPPVDKADRSSFDFLGFTFYWGLSRKGRVTLKVKTAKDRFSRSLQRLNLWCKENRHLAIATQHRTLHRKLIGHYNYYGVSGNYGRLTAYRFHATRVWKKWLVRRSRAAKSSWEWMNRLLQRYALPRPRIIHRLYT